MKRFPLLAILPDLMQVDIISNWLALWDIYMLDMSFSNHTHRKAFLAVLSQCRPAGLVGKESPFRCEEDYTASGHLYYDILRPWDSWNMSDSEYMRDRSLLVWLGHKCPVQPTLAFRLALRNEPFSGFQLLAGRGTVYPSAAELILEMRDGHNEEEWHVELWTAIMSMFPLATIRKLNVLDADVGFFKSSVAPKIQTYLDTKVDTIVLIMHTSHLLCSGDEDLMQFVSVHSSKVSEWYTERFDWNFIKFVCSHCANLRKLPMTFYSGSDLNDATWEQMLTLKNMRSLDYFVDVFGRSRLQDAISAFSLLEHISIALSDDIESNFNDEIASAGLCFRELKHLNSLRLGSWFNWERRGINAGRESVLSLDLSMITVADQEDAVFRFTNDFTQYLPPIDSLTIDNPCLSTQSEDDDHSATVVSRLHPIAQVMRFMQACPSFSSLSSIVVDNNLLPVVALVSASEIVFPSVKRVRVQEVTDSPESEFSKLPQFITLFPRVSFLHLRSNSVPPNLQDVLLQLPFLTELRIDYQDEEEVNMDTLVTALSGSNRIWQCLELHLSSFSTDHLEHFEDAMCAGMFSVKQLIIGKGGAPKKVQLGHGKLVLTGQHSEYWQEVYALFAEESDYSFEAES